MHQVVILVTQTVSNGHGSSIRFLEEGQYNLPTPDRIPSNILSALAQKYDNTIQKMSKELIKLAATHVHRKFWNPTTYYKTTLF